MNHRQPNRTPEQNPAQPEAEQLRQERRYDQWGPSGKTPIAAELLEQLRPPLYPPATPMTPAAEERLYDQIRTELFERYCALRDASLQLEKSRATLAEGLKRFLEAGGELRSGKREASLQTSTRYEYDLDGLLAELSHEERHQVVQVNHRQLERIAPSGSLRRKKLLKLGRAAQQSTRLVIRGQEAAQGETQAEDALTLDDARRARQTAP